MCEDANDVDDHHENVITKLILKEDLAHEQNLEENEDKKLDLEESLARFELMVDDRLHDFLVFNIITEDLVNVHDLLTDVAIGPIFTVYLAVKLV